MPADPQLKELLRPFVREIYEAGKQSAQAVRPPALQPAAAPHTPPSTPTPEDQPSADALPPELLAAMLQARAAGDDDTLDALAELGDDPEGLAELIADLEGGTHGMLGAKAVRAFADRARTFAADSHGNEHGHDGKFTGKGGGGVGKGPHKKAAKKDRRAKLKELKGHYRKDLKEQERKHDRETSALERKQGKEIDTFDREWGPDTELDAQIAKHKEDHPEAHQRWADEQAGRRTSLDSYLELEKLTKGMPKEDADRVAKERAQQQDRERRIREEYMMTRKAAAREPIDDRHIEEQTELGEKQGRERRKLIRGYRKAIAAIKKRPPSHGEPKTFSDDSGAAWFAWHADPTPRSKTRITNDSGSHAYGATARRIMEAQGRAGRGEPEPEKPQATAQRLKAEREPRRQEARQVLDRALADPSSVTMHDLPALAEHIHSLTRDEARQKLRELGVKTGGKLKVDIVNGLVAHVREKGSSARAEKSASEAVAKKRAQADLMRAGGHANKPQELPDSSIGTHEMISPASAFLDKQKAIQAAREVEGGAYQKRGKLWHALKPKAKPVGDSARPAAATPSTAAQPATASPEEVSRLKAELAFQERMPAAERDPASHLRVEQVRDRLRSLGVPPQEWGDVTPAHKTADEAKSALGAMAGKGPATPREIDDAIHAMRNLPEAEIRQVAADLTGEPSDSIGAAKQAIRQHLMQPRETTPQGGSSADRIERDLSPEDQAALAREGRRMRSDDRLRGEPVAGERTAMNPTEEETAARDRLDRMQRWANDRPDSDAAASQAELARQRLERSRATVPDTTGPADPKRLERVPGDFGTPKPVAAVAPATPAAPPVDSAARIREIDAKLAAHNTEMLNGGAGLPHHEERKLADEKRALVAGEKGAASPPGAAAASPPAKPTSIPGHDAWRGRVTPPESVAGRPATKKAREQITRGLQNAVIEARNAMAAKYGTRQINDRMSPEEKKLEYQIFDTLESLSSGGERNGMLDLGPMSDARYAGYYRHAVDSLDKLRATVAAKPSDGGRAVSDRELSQYADAQGYRRNQFGAPGPDGVFIPAGRGWHKKNPLTGANEVVADHHLRQQLDHDDRKRSQEPAPFSEAATFSEKPREVGPQVLPLDEVHVDPERFQYKPGADADGTVHDLPAETYEPEKSKPIAVWHDPADDRWYVIEGHHCRAWAERDGAEWVPVQAVGAKDAEEAREAGRAIDAATFAADTQGNEHGADGKFTSKGAGGDRPSESPDYDSLGIKPSKRFLDAALPKMQEAFDRVGKIRLDPERIAELVEDQSPDKAWKEIVGIGTDNDGAVDLGDVFRDAQVSRALDRVYGAAERVLGKLDPGGEDETLAADWEDAAHEYARHRLRQMVREHETEIKAILTKAHKRHHRDDDDGSATFSQDAQGNEHGNDGKFVGKGGGNAKADRRAERIAEKRAKRQAASEKGRGKASKAAESMLEERAAALSATPGMRPVQAGIASAAPHIMRAANAKNRKELVDATREAVSAYAAGSRNEAKAKAKEMSGRLSGLVHEVTEGRGLKASDTKAVTSTLQSGVRDALASVAADKADVGAAIEGVQGSNRREAMEAIREHLVDARSSDHLGDALADQIGNPLTLDDDSPVVEELLSSWPRTPDLEDMSVTSADFETAYRKAGIDVPPPKEGEEPDVYSDREDVVKAARAAGVEIGRKIVAQVWEMLGADPEAERKRSEETMALARKLEAGRRAKA